MAGLDRTKRAARHTYHWTWALLVNIRNHLGPFLIWLFFPRGRSEKLATNAAGMPFPIQY